RAAAADLGTITGQRAFADLSVHAATDEDWFEFTTTAPAGPTHSARLSFSDVQGDLDLYLYDAAGQRIGSSETTADVETVPLGGLAAGTSSLRVAGYAGDTNPGSPLTVTAPGQAALTTDALEPNGAPGSATLLRNRSDNALAGALTVGRDGSDRPALT